MNENKTMNLAQSLAIDSQLRLPGSAGRLLKQVRDIEQVAPLFRDAGLVKAVPKPTIVNLHVAGIATKSCLDKVLGGFIYARTAKCSVTNLFTSIKNRNCILTFVVAY
jgi:hypothetical protein